MRRATRCRARATHSGQCGRRAETVRIRRRSARKCVVHQRQGRSALVRRRTSKGAEGSPTRASALRAELHLRSRSHSRFGPPRRWPGGPRSFSMQSPPPRRWMLCRRCLPWPHCHSARPTGCYPAVTLSAYDEIVKWLAKQAAPARAVAGRVRRPAGRSPRCRCRPDSRRLRFLRHFAVTGSAPETSSGSSRSRMPRIRLP